jgi:UDP-glucose 4-epimerase
VVVTGGAGFIGSHLVEALVQEGGHVTVVDDLSSGKLENIRHLPAASVKYVPGSITDLPLLQSVFAGVDLVFHEAAIASVPRSIDAPGATHEVNVTGTLNVLVAAKDNGVQKVVFASSCAVYGNTTVLPTGELVPPDPQSPYAVAKLAAEYYCDVFSKVYGLPTVCLRYFNVYGPRQSATSDYAAVIPKFIKMVAEGKPPVIYGDGGQSRDFVFVRDVVAANLLAAERPASGIYNVGTGESADLNRLADTVVNLFGGAAQAVHEAARPGEVRHSKADISRISAMGFRPAYTLRAGLMEMVKTTPLPHHS